MFRQIFPYGFSELVFYIILVCLLYSFYHHFKGNLFKVAISFILSICFIVLFLYIATDENILRLLIHER